MKSITPSAAQSSEERLDSDTRSPWLQSGGLAHIITSICDIISITHYQALKVEKLNWYALVQEAMKVLSRSGRIPCPSLEGSVEGLEIGLVNLL